MARSWKPPRKRSMLEAWSWPCGRSFSPPAVTMQRRRWEQDPARRNSASSRTARRGRCSFTRLKITAAAGRGKVAGVAVPREGLAAARRAWERCCEAIGGRRTPPCRARRMPAKGTRRRQGEGRSVEDERVRGRPEEKKNSRGYCCTFAWISFLY